MTYKSFWYAYLAATLIGSGPLLIYFPLIPVYIVLFPAGLIGLFKDFIYSEGVLPAIIVVPIAAYILYFTLADKGVSTKKVSYFEAFILLLFLNVLGCWLLLGEFGRLNEYELVPKLLLGNMLKNGMMAITVVQNEL